MNVKQKMKLEKGKERMLNRRWSSERVKNVKQQTAPKGKWWKSTFTLYMQLTPYLLLHFIFQLKWSALSEKWVFDYKQQAKLLGMPNPA